MPITKRDYLVSRFFKAGDSCLMAELRAMNIMADPPQGDFAIECGGGWLTGTNHPQYGLVLGTLAAVLK